MDAGNKKKKFIPVKKDRLKAFKEKKASMDSISEVPFHTSMDEGDTMTLEGIVKKKIDLPKKFTKDQAKTGTLDTKKFSIFGEVQADKKKKTKDKNDDDDDLGADLKHWLKGKQLKKTEETNPPPDPKTQSEINRPTLKRTEKEMETVQPQPPPEDDPLDVELTDDEYRDDNDDQAERELAAVFQNDKGEEDEGVTELKSATPTSRSSNDLLKRRNKLFQSPEEKKKPPSRGSGTPGTLKAEKLLKFGDYSLTERAGSKASETNDQSDVEAVSPLPAVEEPQPEAPAPTPPLVVSEDKSIKDGDSRPNTKTPSDGERSDSRGPGKLQFKVQEKKQVKKEVKTGQLNMMKYAKFGEGTVKKNDGGTPESESPLPDAPKRRVMKLSSFDKGKNKFLTSFDDAQAPMTSTLPSQPSAQFSVKRERKITRDESIDPFDNLPETVTEVPDQQNEIEASIKEDKSEKPKLESPLPDSSEGQMDRLSSVDEGRSEIENDAQAPKTSDLPSQPSSQFAVKRQRKVVRDESVDPFENLPETLNEQTKDQNIPKYKEQSGEPNSSEISELSVDVRETDVSFDIGKLDGTPAEEDDKKSKDANVNYDPSGYDLHRIAKLPSPDVIKRRKKMTIHDANDDYLSDLLNNLKDTSAGKKTISKDEQSVIDTASTQKEDASASKDKIDDQNEGLLKLATSPGDVEPISRRRSNLLQELDDDIKRLAGSSDVDENDRTQSGYVDDRLKRTPRTYTDTDFDLSTRRTTDMNFERNKKDYSLDDDVYNRRKNKSGDFDIRDYDSSVGRRPKRESDDDIVPSDTLDDNIKARKPHDFELRDYDGGYARKKPELDDFEYKRRTNDSSLDDYDEGIRMGEQKDFEIRDYDNSVPKSNVPETDLNLRKARTPMEEQEIKMKNDDSENLGKDGRKKKDYDFKVRDYETSDVPKRNSPNLDDLDFKREKGDDSEDKVEKAKVEVDDLPTERRSKKEYDFSVRDYETGDISKRKPSPEDLHSNERTKKEHDFSIRDYETGNIPKRQPNLDDFDYKRKTSSEVPEDPEARKKRNETEDSPSRERTRKDYDVSLRDYDSGDVGRRTRLSDDEDYKRTTKESTDDNDDNKNRSKKEYDFKVRDYDSGEIPKRTPLDIDFDFKSRKNDGDIEDEENTKDLNRRDSKDIIESEEARRRRLQVQFEEEQKRERRRLMKEYEELKRQEQEELERAELEEMKKEEEEQKKRKRSVEFNENKNDYIEPPSVAKRKAIEQEVKEQEQKILERKARLAEAERQRKLDEEEMKKKKARKLSAGHQHLKEAQRERDRRKSQELRELQEYEEKLRAEREKRMAEQLAIEEEKRKKREQRKREREEEREREQQAWEEEQRKRREEEDRKWEELKMRREKRASREKIDQEQLMNLNRLREEKEMKRLEEMRLEREKAEAERLEQLEHQKEIERRIWEKLMERERELKIAEEEVRLKRERLREESEMKLRQFRQDEIKRKREEEEKKQLNKLERKVKKKAQIEHENEEMDRLMELERRRAEERRRKRFEEEERLRNLEIERLREEEERRRREREAIAEEMRKIELLRMQRAEQRRREEEERRRREEEERLRFLEEQRRKAEELERRRREMEEAERLLLLELEEKRRREAERLRLLEEQRRREEEERRRREEEERRRRLETEEERRRREEEERRRRLEEEERRRREAEERALRMMEKNNFDGWSLLAVGEEAIIEESNNKDGGEDAKTDNANEINLVEVEEEQVKRSQEKWILVARGKEEIKEEFEDEWVSLAQGSNVAENRLSNLEKWKAWAREHHQMAESEAQEEKEEENWSNDKRVAWDKRCLPIQVDEFISVQQKYQFVFIGRKGSMKVLKTHSYSVDDKIDRSENGLAKKHSMFFVENTTRDLQDYQLRMRGRTKFQDLKFEIRRRFISTREHMYDRS